MNKPSKNMDDKIAKLRKRYYDLLYEKNPTFRLLGHFQFDKAWELVEEVLRNEKD